jgi:hypothetical protein
MQNKRFTSLIFLPLKLTQDNVNDCLTWFITNNFLGYDYESNSYIELEKVIEKYSGERRYGLRFENQPCSIMCSENKNYIISGTDANDKGANIISSIVNELCFSVKEISFAYFDNEGHAPSKLEYNVKKIEFKWLFKYNYFGKSFIEKYSKDFFTNMPCVKQEFITDEIIRIDLGKDIFEPINETLKAEIDIYLTKFSVKVRFYDYRQNFIE